MDIATIFGIISGIIFIAIGSMGGKIDIGYLLLFVDVPSMYIVGGGTLASALVSLPLKDMLTAWKVGLHTLVYKTESPMEIIKKMVYFAEVARRDGILALEGVTSDLKDEFLVKGIQLAVDGTDLDMIEQIMASEITSIEDRHSRGRHVFDVLAKYGPAWGMIGTLMGLVVMLSGLGKGQMERIGQGMSVALVTTYYGAILANLFAGPMSDKLKIRNDEEILYKNIVLRGIMSIQSGDNPRIVEQKLMIFLPPGLRAQTRKEGA